MLKYIKENKSVIILIAIMIIMILMTCYISGIYISRLSKG